MRIGAVVLAAGKSSRMGVNKLLLDIAGKKVLDRILDVLTQTADDIVVVTGNNPEPIQEIASTHGILVVHNPEHHKGMMTSFQAGIKAMKDIEGVFLVLGDQLGLQTELLRRMIAALEDIPTALIVSPTYHRKRGHPVLFRWSLSGEIITASETLKEVVEKHESQHVYVEGSEWSILDFDTPADFERIKRLFELGK